MGLKFSPRHGAPTHSLHTASAQETRLQMAALWDLLQPFLEFGGQWQLKINWSADILQVISLPDIKDHKGNPPDHLKLPNLSIKQSLQSQRHGLSGHAYSASTWSVGGMACLMDLGVRICLWVCMSMHPLVNGKYLMGVGFYIPAVFGIKTCI